jgi:transcriptional regulator of acetoin/glycerol metabolism
MPMLIAGMPSARAVERSSSAPRRTSATSPSWTRCPFAAAPDDETAEVRLLDETRLRTQRELALLRLEPPRGQLDVLGAQRLLDVRDR